MQNTKNKKVTMQQSEGSTSSLHSDSELEGILTSSEEQSDQII